MSSHEVELLMSGSAGETSAAADASQPNCASEVKKNLQLLFQLLHLVLAAAILLTGFVEFSVEPTIFDVFGEHRSSIPNEVFKHLTNHSTSISDKSLEHILDAPILVLFLIYFLSVLWLKCRGVFAWLLTISQGVSMMLYIGVNAGLAKTILDWRYFSTRAITIILDVLILSFSWTVIVVTLLHIRGWFPFKVKKIRDIPYSQRTPLQKVVVIIWNFIALYLVLGLCLLIWFSKLYMSWACVRFTSEILLLCQFTNMVQCWPCVQSTDVCDVSNITECVQDFYAQPTAHPDGPIRCISPLYFTKPFTSAFCVFNYNIGAFTFVTVFSYVGGIYFFMRTVLNALVKCLYSIGFIAVHFIFKMLKKQSSVKQPETLSVNEVVETREIEERTPLVSADPRVSLLGPLPLYQTSTKEPSKHKTKYV